MSWVTQGADELPGCARDLHPLRLFRDDFENTGLK